MTAVYSKKISKLYNKRFVHTVPGGITLTTEEHIAVARRVLLKHFRDIDANQLSRDRVLREIKLVMDTKVRPVEEAVEHRLSAECERERV